MYADAPAIAYRASWCDFFKHRTHSTFIFQFFHIFLSTKLSALSVTETCHRNLSRITADLRKRANISETYASDDTWLRILGDEKGRGAGLAFTSNSSLPREWPIRQVDSVEDIPRSNPPASTLAGLMGTDETYPMKNGAFRNALCLINRGTFRRSRSIRSAGQGFAPKSKPAVCILQRP